MTRHSKSLISGIVGVAPQNRVEPHAAFRNCWRATGQYFLHDWGSGFRRRLGLLAVGAQYRDPHATKANLLGADQAEVFELLDASPLLVLVDPPNAQLDI